MFTSHGPKQARKQRMSTHPLSSLSSGNTSDLKFKDSSLLLMRISVLHLGSSSMAPDMPSVRLRTPTTPDGNMDKLSLAFDFCINLHYGKMGLWRITRWYLRRIECKAYNSEGDLTWKKLADKRKKSEKNLCLSYHTAACQLSNDN